MPLNINDIQGWSKLEDQMKDIDNLDYGLALKNGAEKVLLPEAKANTPVITGYLRDSEHVEQTGPKTVRLQADADYAGFVEFGTVYFEPRAFFRRAIDSKQDEFVKTVANEIQNQMKSKLNG